MWPQWGTWNRLADQVGAELVTVGGNRCKLRKRFRKWTITLDSWERKEKTLQYGGTRYLHVEQTTLRAPYVPKDLFEWEIFPNSLGMKVLKLLRASEFPLIDVSHHLMIKGNDELKLRQFCANPKLLHLMKSLPAARPISDRLLFYLPYWLISRLPAFRSPRATWSSSWDTFQLRRRPPGLPDGVSEIHFHTEQWFKNLDYLKYLPTLFDLFEEILIQLVAIGSASEEAPNVEL